MKNEFVPYDIALTIKELGCVVVKPFKEYDTLGILQPLLYQQAFRWFREEHKLRCVIDEETDGWNFTIYPYLTSDREQAFFSYDNQISYEEAELECLRKLIEIVKEK